MKPPAPVTSTRVLSLISESCSPAQQNRNRVEEDLAIGCEAHPTDVREVEVRVLVHRPVTACQDLPQPGQPGLHRMAFVLPALVPVDDVHQLGAGPDEAHVAARHVPKLGQLVEAPLAQEPAEWGEPWISRVLVRDPAVRRVLDAGPAPARVHGAELVHGEHAATATHASLLE